MQLGGLELELAGIAAGAVAVKLPGVERLRPSAGDSSYTPLGLADATEGFFLRCCLLLLLLCVTERSRARGWAWRVIQSSTAFFCLKVILVDPDMRGLCCDLSRSSDVKRLNGLRRAL